MTSLPRRKEERLRDPDSPVLASWLLGSLKENAHFHKPMLTPDTNADSADSTQAAGSDKSTVFDFDTSLQQIGGEPELLLQLIQVYLDQVPDLTRKLDAAVAAASALDIRHAAHAIKGSVSVVGGLAARNAAQTVESQARAGILDTVQESTSRLHQELVQLEAKLREALSKSAA